MSKQQMLQPKVNILMSSYNGEKYLQEQLDSLAGQTYANIGLFVRDDGSVDGTRKILEAFKKKMTDCKKMEVVLYEENNIGVIQSFLKLIQLIPMDAKYYAFCDQDDMWLPDKIERAVEKMEKVNSETEVIPLLYCGTPRLADETMKEIQSTVSRKVRKIDFGNAMVQNMCTGCTAVVNRQMIEMIRDYLPEYMVMHDWWLYLLGTCFGKVIYDERVPILYRQHGNNTSGAMLSKYKLLLHRLRQVRKTRGEIPEQIKAFKKVFKNKLDDQTEAFLQNFIDSYKSKYGRIRLALDYRYYRQKYIDDCVYRLSILIHKL